MAKPTDQPSRNALWLAVGDPGTNGASGDAAFGGFGFANPFERTEQEGEYLILSDRRMALSVSMRGVVTAGVVATAEMLGWAMDGNGYPGRLNVVAVTETTLEYFRFADERVLRRDPLTRWRHRRLALRLKRADPRGSWALELTRRARDPAVDRVA